MSVRVTPLQAIERNGLRGFGFSVFIDRDDAAHSNFNQACPPPAPEEAGPSVPPLGDGPADQSCHACRSSAAEQREVA